VRARYAVLLLLALGCRAESEPYALPIPEWFPQPAVPADNPLTAEKVELGRRLFYDTRLSGNQTQSCASCHEQEIAFTDGERVSVGSTGEAHVRNANSLTNVGYNATLTWANPILTDLETQILIPLFGDAPVEMGASPGEEAVLARLADDPETRERFEDAFPERDEPVTWDTTIDALASFNRTLISWDAPFDQFVAGDSNALTESEQRGLELFLSERLECHHCHGGFNFSEATTHAESVFDAAMFQNTGLYNIDGEGAYPTDNPGVFEITGDPADMGRFRAPSLRNVEVTAPYMHDGSVETLDEVIRIYERGGRLIESGPYAGDGALSPLKSGLIPGFELTDQERIDLIAFLHALTDTAFLTNPDFGPPID
jgi:cytochrome c peroxidase